MSHEITKLNIEVKRLKVMNENMLSMHRALAAAVTKLRADIESFQAKGAGGASTNVPNRNALHADPPMHSGVGEEVPK